MKKFFQTIKHIFAIEDLRVRILNTLALLIIFRLGSFVVLPGLDPVILQNNTAQGIFGFLDTFLGGAFSNASIFALGIMPYISASIIMQLMAVAVPSIQKMQREGDTGRKKITQITRVLTIAITLFQGFGYLNSGIIPAEAILVSPFYFKITAVLLLTAGTVFTMWLGEKITDRGIGNGISMLIMIGIISRLPAAAVQEFLGKTANNQYILLLLEALAFFFVIVASVMLTQAVRRIPIQYAKQVSSRGGAGGARQYLPIKLNASGVMPIIFAQALMFLPPLLASIWQGSEAADNIGRSFSDYTSWQYNVVFGLLIIVFTFVYTAITVNPSDMAENLKRNGGFIPGVKPGKSTSDFIDNVLSRITFPGSVFLALVAVLPAFAFLAGVSREFSQFYGGTSLLIMVGVVLDTLSQIESYLLMHRYEGMMKSGKVRGRSQVAA